MKEVLPGIYLLTLTLSDFNPDSINTYLIKTSDGFLSIDSGWDSPPSLQSVEEQLKEIGASITDIKQVIITHCHIDHMGLIVRYKRYHNARIYIHENEIEMIKVRFTGGDNYIPMTDKFLRIHGMPETELPPPEVQLPVPPDLAAVTPDILLHGGEIIPAGEYNLRVINTPGHTPGHIALYEPDKKFLFSGDTLLPSISTNAAIHVQHIKFPMQKYLESLMTLKKLDVSMVLPGHEHIFTGHRERIEELVSNHESKSAHVLDSLSDGVPRTAYEVSRILAVSPRTGIDHWPKLAGWDRRFAVLQAIAHLESLRFTQKVKLTVQAGIHYYQIIKA